MTDWLFPKMQAASDGANYYFGPSDPICVVWHTTEITTAPLDGAWVAKWASPSHIVADPYTQQVRQCVSLSRGAKALWNDPGGVETNLNGCVWQVEIHMKSPDPRDPTRPDLTDDQYRWLAEAVLVPLAKEAAARGWPLDLDNTPEAGVIPGSAMVNAPQRFSFAQWVNFRGNCGHRHVPENDHWDAGALNLPKLVGFAKEAMGPTTPQPQEAPSNMPEIIFIHSAGTAYGLYSSGYTRQLTSAEYPLINSKGVPEVRSTGPSDDVIVLISRVNPS
jgi:hypothetical protein